METTGYGQLVIDRIEWRLLGCSSALKVTQFLLRLRSQNLENWHEGHSS